jgi:hypothetical protein
MPGEVHIILVPRASAMEVRRIIMGPKHAQADTLTRAPRERLPHFSKAQKVIGSWWLRFDEAKYSTTCVFGVARWAVGRPIHGKRHDVPRPQFIDPLRPPLPREISCIHHGNTHILGKQHSRSSGRQPSDDMSSGASGTAGD